MIALQARRVARHVPVLLRGRPLYGRERYRPFFIVGSGRCGSTLLRAMLEAHPDVHIPPENALGAVVRDYRRFSRLPWNVILRICLGTMEFRYRWEQFGLPLGPLYRDLERLSPERRNLAAMLDALYRAHVVRYKPAATRWGDKTPGNAFALDALRAVFPDARVIHLVRDGRDVVTSWMRTTREQLPPLARQWLRAVRAARRFGEQQPRQYLELRYEDLVRDPRPVLEKTAAFIDISFDDRMLRHQEFDLPLLDIRLAFHDRVREPVHEAAVGRWRTTLTSDQIGELERLLGPTLVALGYDHKS